MGPLMTEEEYLGMAYNYALKSLDPSTQNGALLANPEGLIISYGANNFPRGVERLDERWERPGKYQWVEHAERNSIFSAAKHGEKTQGATMYCPWFACADCARAIIQAGIVRVVGHDTPLHEGGSDSWKQSIAVANTMLDEAGVERSYIEADFGIQIRFNEQLVKV